MPISILKENIYEKSTDFYTKKLLILHTYPVKVCAVSDTEALTTTNLVSYHSQ